MQVALMLTAVLRLIAGNGAPVSVGVVPGGAPVSVGVVPGGAPVSVGVVPGGAPVSVGVGVLDSLSFMVLCNHMEVGNRDFERIRSP
jgi:anti-sigma-K factor RskA